MTWMLEGKTVLLTGASRGIGKTLAIALADRGANVAVVGKTMEPHAYLKGTLPETVAAVEAAGGQATPFKQMCGMESRCVDVLEKCVARHH